MRHGIQTAMSLLVFLANYLQSEFLMGFLRVMLLKCKINLIPLVGQLQPGMQKKVSNLERLTWQDLLRSLKSTILLHLSLLEHCQLL